MPFVLLFVGALFLVTAVRGTSGTLFTLIKSDFTGSNNFLLYLVGIIGIGAIGYVKKLQPISDAFLALLIVVMFLSNKGFFNSFLTQVQNPVTPTSTASSATSTTTSNSTGTSSSLLGGLGGTLTSGTSNPTQSFSNPIFQAITSFMSGQ